MFPGLVEREILSARLTKFKSQIIRLYMIKVDVEVVRFGILVDGKDEHKFVLTNGDNSE